MSTWHLPPAEQYTSQQHVAIQYPRQGGGSLLLRGPAGTGKSTALVARLVSLLRAGARPSELLVLVPQRSFGDRFEQACAQLEEPTRGGVDIVTYYGLARREVDLFWPLVARVAGFAQPEREPIFLTIETAQYHLWRLVEPLIRDEGYFADLVIRRGRLLSQLIDNLNKAALVGFDYTTLHTRLSRAWSGSPDRTLRYLQAQDCAIRFREHCLQHNLLDFSLVTEVYSRHLLTHPVYRRYFRARYRHLLVDNLEENVPVAHDLIGWAIAEDETGQCASAVLALDEAAGYRVFLGADPRGAETLAQACHEVVAFHQPLRTSQAALAFVSAVTRAVGQPLEVAADALASKAAAPRAAIIEQFSGRYWISMVRWVVQRCADLVEAGIDPSDIAIIAPYVSDVMQFAVREECRAAGIAVQLLRPSAEMRQDPVIRGVLSLALLGHPAWDIRLSTGASGMSPVYRLPREDVALALETALAGLDPIRAIQLAQEAVPPGERSLQRLVAIDDADDGEPDAHVARRRAALWEQVGFQTREAYAELQTWLSDYQTRPAEPLDLFLSRLFGELLSTPRFGLYRDAEKARAYGRLVESAGKFRQVAVQLADEAAIDSDDVGREFVQLILSGIASAEYGVDRPQSLPAGIVLAPAYTYLTRDLRSRYQFWLDLGADGWMNRPYQPLTQPYVLSRWWEPGLVWTDADEEAAKRDNLVRVLRGLAARCSDGLYLAHSQLGIGGEEQNGRLARAVLTALSRRG